jgi:hypothetical protein
MNDPFAPTKKHPDAIRGLGDIVAAVANPIARVLDRKLGTRIEGCAGCAKRRDWLNTHVPLKNNYVVMTPRPYRRMEPEYDRAIVIPWLSVKEKWQELRYTLRSIHTHFADKECPIVLIGDRPPVWMVEGTRLRHVRSIDSPSREDEMWDTLQRGVQIARTVAWWNDDIYLLQDTGWNDLTVALTEGVLDKKEKGLSASMNSFWRGLGHAAGDLRRAGFSPIHRFATHTPYLFEVEKSREILRSYFVHYKGSWETLYHNHHQTPHTACAGHKCMRLPAGGNERYLNHKDAGPDDETKRLLMEMFPDPAPWEKQG